MKLKDLLIRTIYTETNNNAQAQECFKIKKRSSNINRNIILTEFFELNYHDNCELFWALTESFIQQQQVPQLKNKDKKNHKIKSTCGNLLSNNTNKVKCNKKCSNRRKPNTALS